MLALKEFTLHGSRYQHGSRIPAADWGRVAPRLQKVLARNRFVTEETVETATPPVRRRGRPRKGA